MNLEVDQGYIIKGFKCWDGEYEFNLEGKRKFLSFLNKGYDRGFILEKLFY